VRLLVHNADPTEMRVVFALLCLGSVFALVVYGQKPAVPILDQEDVWLLVMNIPEVMQVEARKGCPHLEFLTEGKDQMYVQVRNQCPVSGNGMMGNYTVDLRNGRIWFDVDETKTIDSERLRRLRKALLSCHQPRAEGHPKQELY